MFLAVGMISNDVGGLCSDSRMVVMIEVAVGEDDGFDGKNYGVNDDANGVDGDVGGDDGYVMMVP